MYKQVMSGNDNHIDKLLHHCLYFTANRMSRIITHMAEEEFRVTGISPTYAFLLMIVNENDGISQKDFLVSICAVKNRAAMGADREVNISFPSSPGFTFK